MTTAAIYPPGIFGSSGTRNTKTIEWLTKLRRSPLEESKKGSASTGLTTVIDYGVKNQAEDDRLWEHGSLLNWITDINVFEKYGVISNDDLALSPDTAVDEFSLALSELITQPSPDLYLNRISEGLLVDYLRQPSGFIFSSGGSEFIENSSRAIKALREIRPTFIDSFNAYYQNLEYELKYLAFSDQTGDLEKQFGDQVRAITIQNRQHALGLLFEMAESKMDSFKEEFIIAMAMIGDPESHQKRLKLTTKFLFASSKYIRDAAAIGLSYLNDKTVISDLKMAIEVEYIPELKEDLMAVLEQLETSGDGPLYTNA